MPGQVIGAFLFPLLTLAAPLAGSTPEAAHRPVPEVGEEELASWLAHGPPGRAEDRDAAFGEVLLVRAFSEEALRLGLDRRPATKMEILTAEGQLAMSELRRHVNASIEVSAEEAEAKYRAIKDTYTLPRRVRLRNLFKRFPLEASEGEKAELRAAMEALRGRVLEGADFAELAEAESESQTRLQGGLLGNVRAGTLRPRIDRVAMAMVEGEVSEVLEEPEGLTLLYCERVLPKVHRTPEELREIARNLLESAAWRADWAAMEALLLRRAAPEWRWRALAAGDGSVDPEAVLLETTGGSLTVAEVAALVAPRGIDRMVALGTEQIESRARPHLRRWMAIEEVAVRGLKSEALAGRARWKRLGILASKAIAEEVGRRLLPVTDADAEALYRAEPERFQRSAHYRLGVIALPFDAADPRPAYELGQRLVASLSAGEASFPDLARRYSREPSAESGGDSGWLSRRALPRVVGIDGLRAILRLAPGGRSGWVRDDEASLLRLIELRGYEEARPLAWEEAREAARNLVGQRRAEALQAKVTAEWLERLTSPESSTASDASLNR